MLYQCVAHAGRWIWGIAHCSCHSTYPVLWLIGFSQIAEKKSFSQSSQQKLSTVSHLEQEKVMSCYFPGRSLATILPPRGQMYIEHLADAENDVPKGAEGSRREQGGIGAASKTWHGTFRVLLATTAIYCCGPNWDQIGTTFWTVLFLDMICNFSCGPPLEG